MPMQSRRLAPQLSYCALGLARSRAARYLELAAMFRKLGMYSEARRELADAIWHNRQAAELEGRLSWRWVMA